MGYGYKYPSNVGKPDVATKLKPDQATLPRVLRFAEACCVHAIPSGEVRIAPGSPTTTNLLPDQATPCRLFVVPETCGVHTVPLSEISIVPFPPTATNLLPDQITPCRLL